MALSSEKLYKAHVLNLKAVNRGIAHVERGLRVAISKENEHSSDTFLKLLLLLTGAWAECRLRKLQYERSGFNENDQQLISSQSSQVDRWLFALETGYRKRYSVPRAQLSDRTLGATAWQRYRSVRELIENDLRPMIEMRNTLAHGQWTRPLNSDENNSSSGMLKSINQENALAARFKLILLGAVADLVHDLVSTEEAFERDYDDHFKKIVGTRTNLMKRSYENWKRTMIEKYNRGHHSRKQKKL